MLTVKNYSLLLWIYFFTINYCLKTCLTLNLPQGFSDRPLLPQKLYSCCKNEPYISHRDIPVVYCYLGSPRSVFNVWQSASAVINLVPEQYELFEGEDAADVYRLFEAHRTSWSVFSLVNFRRKDIQLNPFNKTCLGILTNHDYTIKLEVTKADLRRVVIFSAGIVLFFLAPTLANEPLFYYLTGIIFGVSASVGVLFYFLFKMLPLKKPAMVGMFVGGSSIAYYLFHTFYDNIFALIYTYREYAVGYLVVSAVVSLVVCYRFGPVSNPRSINLIKWFLQAIALFMIYLSSYLEEVTIGTGAVILFFYNVPIFRWIFNFLMLSKKMLFKSKPRQRLLTRDEFQEQGEVETKKGLEQLREYCNSPECKHWQTVLRLRDPHRFAKFMEGKSHVSREEIEKYEEECKEMMDLILTDDDTDSGED